MLGIQGILGILVPYGIFRDSLYEELTKKKMKTKMKNL